MMELQPFSPIPYLLRLTGEIAVEQKDIVFTFRLEDPTIVVAGGMNKGKWDATTGARRDELWHHTCFEAFWSLPSEERYFELNLSGSGAWNVYEFTSYREPFPPQETAAFAMIEQESDGSVLRCRLRGREPHVWETSLCAIIKTKSDETHFFSTKHAGAKPNFHDRKSLVLKRG